MVNDYISRQYLLDEYDRQHKGPPGGARKIIVEAPAADVIPVRHGEWIFNGYEWECSECRCVVEDEKPTWNFCPNCGTKMDVRV